MRHQKRVAKLGRTASHRKALLSNLASSLIQHGKIKTTDAKAKELRKVVERLVTYGKKGTIHHRRLAYRTLQDRALVKTLFDHIAPQYADRNGGYTRIVKLGFRDNDCAPVSLIEFVDYTMPGEKKKSMASKNKQQAKTQKSAGTKSTKPVEKEENEKEDIEEPEEKVSELKED
jgi:large subunit ribosomal protein L17